VRILTGALLALPGLALLLLAAHWLHSGQLPLAVLSLLLAGLLAVRRPWAARVVQAVLILAAVEWILTTVALAQLRQQQGEPYLRLTLILGAVTAFTLVAAWIFQRPALRAWFGRPGLGTTGP
jgi:uncharacterized membrane protein